MVVPVPDEVYGQRPVAFVKGSTSRQALTDALASTEKFKHPDHFFAWPKDLGDRMKPDRNAMRRLAELLVK